MAIDQATGRIYWANSDGTTISFARLDGSGGGDLNTTGATVSGPEGVALDPAANRIYWANNASPYGISFANLDGTGGGGNLNTTGATVNAPVGPAVDKGSGRVYWSNFGGNVISYANIDGSGGGDLNTSGATVSSPAGVAIDAVDNRVYWTNYASAGISYANLDGTGGGGNLNVAGASPSGPFGSPALLLTAPAAVTGAASGITTNTATLNGTVNPEGQATTYHFDYGTSTAYGSSTPTQNAGARTTSSAVSAGLTGLQPNTTYHFRLVAQNASGTTTGADNTFTTPATPAVINAPLVTTGAASAKTRNSATLNGTVNPRGQATSYHFEFGTSTAYGSATSTQSAGSGTTAKAVQAHLTGLKPNTTYHYRLVAHNAAGTTHGADHTFKTQAVLKLSISTRTTPRAGVRTCYALRVTAAGHSVRGATVKLAGHSTRTSRSGKATLCLTLRAGHYTAHATARGFAATSARVTVRAAAPAPPRFTG